MKHEPWIAVDLDGTLAHYDGWGDPEIGKPIPKMMARVKRWIEDGKDVRILTARADRASEISKIQDWLESHELPRLPVTNRKDHNMEVLYDDRAIGVVKNKGILLTKPESTGKKKRKIRAWWQA